MINNIIEGLTWMASESGMSVAQFVAAYVLTNTGFLVAGYYIVKMYKQMIAEEFGK